MTSRSTPSSSARSFADLGVPQRLIAALQASGIDAPFPVQVATIPDALAGRDVLGRGRTGSGKTLAFALPLITRLADSGRRTRAKHPRALILLPTRELATQVHTAMTPLAAAAGLTTTTIFGGVGQGPQVKALARGVDIVIACPGRLEDLMRQGSIRLDEVETCVLDEADHMADLGFLPGVRRILEATPRDGQRLLFSATLDGDVQVLVKRFLHNPVTHSVDDDKRTEPDMDHHVLTVSRDDKTAVVRELASGQGRSVLFTRTKHSARKLARDLTMAGVPAVDLHGNLSQSARDRNLESFRSGGVRVLVATDVAARGIHVDDVALVVHVDPPAEHKAYLHRSGRTARAGARGTVVTIQTADQRGDVAMLTRKAGVKPTITAVTAGAPRLRELTGPRAAHVEPSRQVAAAAEQGERRHGGGYGARGHGRRSSGGAKRSDRTGRAEASSSTARVTNSGTRTAGKATSSATRRTSTAADFSSSRSRRTR